MIGSESFQMADRFTAGAEGGKTYNDGTGHRAAYGIDQNAHPEIDVMSLTPEQAQAIRHTYWQAINGDHLAQLNPQLALIAYDTAIMSGPGKAIELLRQSQGSAARMVDLRTAFHQELVANNPEKYGGAARNWAQRDAKLADVAGGAPSETTSAAAPAAAPASTSGAPAGAAAAPAAPVPALPPEKDIVQEPSRPVAPTNLAPLAVQHPLAPGEGALAKSTQQRYQELVKNPPDAA